MHVRLPYVYISFRIKAWFDIPVLFKNMPFCRLVIELPLMEAVS